MDTALHRPNLHAPRLARPDPPPLQQAERLRLRRRRPQLLQQQQPQRQKLRNDHLAANEHHHLRRAQEARRPLPRREPDAPVAIPALAAVALESVHERLLRQQQQQRQQRSRRPAPELLPPSRGGLQEPEAELFDAEAAERGEVVFFFCDEAGELREVPAANANGKDEPGEASFSVRGQGERGVDFLLGVRLGPDGYVCSAHYHDACCVLQQAGRVLIREKKAKRAKLFYYNVLFIYYICCKATCTTYGIPGL